MTSSALAVAVAAAVWLGWLACATASAQANGDQIIDGIGETSLVARYPFNGTGNDRSRDGHNGTVTGGEFVDDPRFGRVLQLSGGDEAAVELPPSILKGSESVSIVGWFRPRELAARAVLFDLSAPWGHVSCAFDPHSDRDAFQAAVVRGAERRTSPLGPLDHDRWSHVAVVYDAADNLLYAYVNGEQQGGSGGSGPTTRPAADAAGRATIGARFNCLLRDVRIYSVALTPAQVATIYRNGSGRSTTRPRRSGPATRDATPLLVDFGGAKLQGVSDVSIDTDVGQLPRLPETVAGQFAGNAQGPRLRVIWPSPRSNADVAAAGQYVLTGRVPGTPFETKATVTVRQGAATQPSPRRQLEPFALGQVTLDSDDVGQKTPFQRNRDKFIAGLAKTNPDDFLYMFRDAFGQPQPGGARALGVWDSQTTRLRGHATGHYLSALAQAYASSTYDEKLRTAFAAKMNYTIDALHTLAALSGEPQQPGGPANSDPTKVPPAAGRENYDSDLEAGRIRTDSWNWGRGFISAYPPDQFIMLERGATYGTGNNQIWAPYYTLHKILAGLLDCYEVGGNRKALDVARGMGLWTYERLKALPAETRIAMWNRYIAGEYGGMNEVLARLGRLTGDNRFLDAAKLFDNTEFFFGTAKQPGGLAANVDTLRGKHANQHIPQALGALETFADTNDPTYLRVAENFWAISNRGYTYSIGGVAGALNPNNAECFTAEPDTLWQNGLSEGGQNETCATYNLLKLSRGLFMYRPDDSRYMDYYERAIHNDILASVAEHDAGNTYHIPLNPGARKSFGNADMHGFTCCNGTALESNTKLQDTIYLRVTDGSAVYVNLFVPSTLRWTERGLTLRQQTSYPYSDTIRLTVNGGRDTDLIVRVPGWATNGFVVKVNGVERPTAAKPGSYLNLGRSWNDGDTIEVRMPFGFHLSRLMDRPNIASLIYGPIVLAADEPAARSDWRRLPIDPNEPGKGITGDPARLRFRLGDVSLRPFFESYGRYSVYFDVSPK